MKRQSLPLIFLLIQIFFPLSLQAQSEGRIVFMPPHFYVGDRVDIMIPLGEAEPVITLSAGEDPWLEVLSYEVRPADKGSLLVVTVISYYPGVKSLEGILVNGTPLKPVKISTLLLSDNGSSELKPLKPPMLLPSTIWGGGLILVALFTLPFMLYLAWRGLRMLFRKFFRFYRRWRPMRAFQRDFSRICADEAGGNIKESYYMITELVRQYLGLRVRPECISTVTGEMIALLSPVLTPETLDRLVASFYRADRIKFAGDEGSRDEWSLFTEEILDIVKSIEKEVQGHDSL